MPCVTRGEDTWHMGRQVSCSCHAWEDSGGQVSMGDTWYGVCPFLYRLKTPQIHIVVRALHFSCIHVTLDKFP